MEQRITVTKDSRPVYDIYFEQDYGKLKEMIQALSMENKRVMIITDENIAPHHLDEVKNIFSQNCQKVCAHVISPGEEHKNLDTIRTFYERLIKERFDRNDMIAALGGGVIGDMAGFTAATFLRGIDFIQMPTTLLSMVDSSIGGKTGVDFDAYKNMVGAFYMPRAVYINLSVLNTLPDEQFVSGMGEVVKHGFIGGREFYDWIGSHREEIKKKEPSVLKEMVYKSCQIKKKVVEIDPEERGIRATLNFGHTLGHSIEKNKNFTMLHGLCVGAGMVCALYLSMKRGLISRQDFEKAKEQIEFFGLPAAVEGLDANEILDSVKNDKKMLAGQIRFILLKSIGEAYIDNTVTKEEMREALLFLQE